MNKKNDLDLIEKNIAQWNRPLRPQSSSSNNIQKVLSTLHRRQNAGSLLNFGVVRFWIMILEIFAFFYTKNNLGSAKSISTPKV
jgi:hypothetical protein